MGRSQQRQDTEGGEHRRRGMRSPGVWLATLSTVVGVATGMFTLRDQVFPGESGSAVAVSVPAYQHEVGSVCDDVNENDEARAEEDERLEDALDRAKTAGAQRDALLESVRRVAADSGHTLTAFAALETPAALRPVQQDVERAWERNLGRLRGYATALDQAGSRAEVVAAVEDLSDERTPLARDAEVLRTGLTKLGADSCDLETPIVTATLTLPALPSDGDGDAKPAAAAATKPGAGDDDTGGESVNNPGNTATPPDEPGPDAAAAGKVSGASVNTPPAAGLAPDAPVDTGAPAGSEGAPEAAGEGGP